MSADKRPQLINAHFIVILALLIAAVVMVLSYKASNFDATLDDLHPDALSVAYLRAMLQADPASQAVRLNLARHYLASGAWQNADQVLNAGGDSFRHLPQVQWLMLQLQLARYRATSPGQAGRQAMQERLTAAIKALSTFDLSAEQLAQLADISLQISMPREAVQFYAAAAVREPPKASFWFANAARCALAANQPSLAGDYYRKAFQAVPGAASAIEMALAAAGAYEAADQGDRALAVIRQALEAHPRNERLLARGILLALARQEPQAAFEWNSRYLRLRPDDPAVLKRQLELSIQLGRPKEALAFSKRYLVHVPQDRAALRRHAELAEWNAQYDEALQTWRVLAVKARDPGIYKHIQNLAQSSFRVDAELEALDVLAARPALPITDVLNMADRYEYLGYPEKADALFSVQKPDRALLTAQALLRQRMGELQMALESRKQLAALSDSRPEDKIQVARLLWQLGRIRQAYEAMGQLPERFAPADPDTALLIGELAWRQGDYKLAATVYQRLWLDTTDNDFARRRMVLAYRQLDRTADAVALLRAHWARTGDRNDLFLAMLEARQAQLWPELGHLLDLAGQVEEQFAADSTYWQLKGDWLSYRQEYGQAFQAFRRALDCDPHATAAADGMLWSLINAGDRRQLDYWLAEHVRAGLPRSDAYAAALQVLGRYGDALAWYQDRLARHRRDALWLLDLADLLDKDSRADAALRVRRHALEILMASPQQVPADRQAALIAALKGVPAAAHWLAGKSGQLTSAALVNWWLQRERYDTARLWLLRRHIERTQLPGWQQLQLAMAARDRSAVGVLIEADVLADAGDRMTAWAYLDRHDLALAGIGNLGQLSPGQRAAAAAAAAHVPNFGELSFNSRMSSGLNIVDHQARGWISRGPRGLGLEATQSQFNAQNDSGLTVAPEPEFSLNVGWRLRQKDLWDLEAGLRDGNGGTVIPLKVMYRSVDAKRWQYQLALHKAAGTETSGLLRLLGVEDSLTTQVDYRMDSRLSASLRGGLHHYRSLAGSDLADGRTAGLTLTYRLAGGVYPCLLSAGGAWEHNAVVDQLPADLRPKLNAGVRPSVFVPESYRDAGLSIYLGRGRLREDFPQVAGPRWFTELWVGTAEPGSGLVVAAHSGVGFALSGSDELGLTVEYDDRLNRTVDSGATFELRLYYRYYLGR